MASDRILIVRILGTGFPDDPSEPLTFTSRSGLNYLPANTVNGVIAEMSAQFSSEIPMFGTIGSDPTTYFTLLSNPTTLPLALSRATAPLRNTTNGGAVRTSGYVIPSPNPKIECDDSSLLSVNDLVRIGGSAFRVTEINNTTSFEAVYAFGSHPVPIPLQIFGTSRPQGAVINAIRLNQVDYPSGGIEQLPVIISTAPFGANYEADEEVIFRGMISKVSVDTSSRGTNQIKVDCSSLIGMIRNTPFRPIPMTPYVWDDTEAYTDGHALDIVNPAGDRLRDDLLLESVWDPRLQGPPWEASLGTPYETRVGLVQLRKDKTGAIFNLTATSEYGELYTIRAGSNSEVPEEALAVTVGGFLYYFSEGVYARGVAPALTLDYEFTNTIPDGAVGGSMIGTGYAISSEWRSEVCFAADTIVELVIDLIFGSVNTDANGVNGARPATMAAWLPFGWSSIPQIVNFGQMRATFGSDTQESMPYVYAGQKWTVLPYKHAEAKTVGDVLDHVLKRTGSFMVYDRGQLRFGQWANAGVWPTAINDAGLAEPQINLEFSRENGLQQVEIDWAQSVRDKDIVRAKIPIVNTDRALSASGKQVTLGNFVLPYSANGLLETSQALQMGLALITRYSKPAAIVTVTYRDAVYDLSVGEFVTFSSDFIPNALGAMGVQGVNGFVIKAARSWKTPTTEYTLWLYGYTTASDKVALLSSTGVVRSLPDSYKVKLEANEYSVAYPGNRPGAPASDAESFAQSLARTAKKKLALQLLDEYGTPYLVTSVLSDVDAANDELTFDDDNFSVAKLGDVIVLADAATNSALDADQISTSWDAYQADGNGEILGQPTWAYPWSV